MALTNDLSPAVRDTLIQLVQAGDRSSPTVFAGRQSEFALLDSAVRGVQRGELGRTVVIQGVPGAGKTALSNEYAARLLAADGSAEHLVVPVLLDSSALDLPPASIVEEIDMAFREFGSSSKTVRRIDQVADGMPLAVDTLFAMLTKKDFKSFRPAAKAPDSLPVALADYAAFRLDRRESTIALLVDEAQNLPDTSRVRRHLSSLHHGIRGRTKALLACFGLRNTVDRLVELGVSRLAREHKRTIGALSNEDATRCVAGTVEFALADHTFDDSLRCRWIDEATGVILDESANFPHHITNGCHALAEILLDEGIGDAPPVERLREKCRECKQEYYDDRLRPWAKHATALAHCFTGSAGDGWTPIEDVVGVLTASDDYGQPVGKDDALAVIEELCAKGFVDKLMGSFRPVLPSLVTHFAELRQAHAAVDNQVLKAVRAAVDER